MNIPEQVQLFVNNLSLEATPPDKVHEVVQSVRNFYEQIATDQQALGFCMFRVAEYIMRLKATH